MTQQLSSPLPLAHAQAITSLGTSSSSSSSSVRGKDQHGAEDAHVLADELHLVPELDVA